MLTEILQTIFDRDLKRLQQEIEAYKTEENIWLTEGAIANSAGNLCLHVIGNLNTYVGAVLGNTGYIRNREAEFSTSFHPRQQLVAQVQQTAAVVNRVLKELDPAALHKEYPVLVWEKPVTTEYLLVHLATHLGYHLGQVNYHRRLLDARS